MELDVLTDDRATEVGSYFISNYPPYSAWRAEEADAAHQALMTRPAPESPTPLGLYLHIPFCRKRCKFCYFRVYTDKNSREVERYLAALTREIALYSGLGFLAGREFEFVYFGGGTPSYLSSDQLHGLIDRINRHWQWDRAREVTFECEPGTLKKGKLEAIKAIGTTRLSLGVEHFDDEVLELNGRAHKSPEIGRSYEWAREVGFDQINIDLIAGMVGETESKWKSTVERALALDPDSVTIYQMEIPHNTTIAQASKESGSGTPVADWATKRAWVNHAFRSFEQAGYVVSSAYTLVKPGEGGRFLYRDSLWHGADLVGTGVASFSHVGGTHYQNRDQWDTYLADLDRDVLPISRALPTTDHQRLVRELILQLKTGRIHPDYFANKFGVDVRQVFADAWKALEKDGFAEVGGDDIRLTRAGLLRADGLLPLFFEPQYRRIRYT